MTIRAATARIAVVVSIALYTTTLLPFADRAFDAAALSLFLIAMSAGVLVPSLDGPGLRRPIAIIADAAILIGLWLVCYGTLHDYTGGGRRLVVTLLVAAAAYAAVCSVTAALLRWSPKLGRFARIGGKGTEGLEPDEANLSDSRPECVQGVRFVLQGKFDP